MYRNLIKTTSMDYLGDLVSLDVGRWLTGSPRAPSRALKLPVGFPDNFVTFFKKKIKIMDKR